ncbi:hypothetical protein B0H14DRAFT_2638967 [Mycena olivaceomarginata]|nr:hypothetical protein B0H14DRAFT_2638967 [Mycena olivaceomarginata]
MQFSFSWVIIVLSEQYIPLHPPCPEEQTCCMKVLGEPAGVCRGVMGAPHKHERGTVAGTAGKAYGYAKEEQQGCFLIHLIFDNAHGVLIEAMSYHVGHHSTSDDSFAYQQCSEVEDRKRIDNSIVWWNADVEEALEARLKTGVMQVFKRAEALPRTTSASCSRTYYLQLWRNTAEYSEIQRNTVIYVDRLPNTGHYVDRAEIHVNTYSGHQIRLRRVSVKLRLSVRRSFSTGDSGRDTGGVRGRGSRAQRGKDKDEDVHDTGEAEAGPRRPAHRAERARQLGFGHFTSRVVERDGWVWFHDGITTGRSCTREFRYEERVDNLRLQKCSGRNALAMVYASD